MSFDAHLFMLHGMTKAEAIDYLRQINGPLSTRAAAAVADIFDRKVDSRGRKTSKPPIKQLMFLGALRALSKHGFFLKKDRGASLEEIAAKCVGGTSTDSLKRAMLTNAKLFHDSQYLNITFRLFAAGKIHKIKILKNISGDMIESEINNLINSEKLTNKQAKEIRNLIK